LAFSDFAELVDAVVVGLKLISVSPLPSTGVRCLDESKTLRLF